MIGEAAIGIMLEVAAQPADPALDPRVLVDLFTAKAAAPPVEQPHEPVRICISVAEETPEIIRDARDRPAGECAEAGIAHGLDLALAAPR